jgi:hypothetical protein
MSESNMVFDMSDINFKSSRFNGNPFSSLNLMIFCALRSLIPVIPFKKNVEVNKKGKVIEKCQSEQERQSDRKMSK